MQTSQPLVVSDYKCIIKRDGPIRKTELIEMLKVDSYVPIIYRTEKGLNYLANQILKIETRKSKLPIATWMQMYQKGLTDKEIG